MKIIAAFEIPKDIGKNLILFLLPQRWGKDKL
jgi:hypothetical protein